MAGLTAFDRGSTGIDQGLTGVDQGLTGIDQVTELAEALAELLDETGARVAVRTPQGAAPPAPAGARRGGEAFVLRGRFIVVKGRGADDEGERLGGGREPDVA